MADSKSCISIEASSVDDENSEASPAFTIESCLPGNYFSKVMQDLLFFESQIERKFVTTNALYKFTCGNTECGFTCGVPHIMLVVRVGGLADDRVGIIIQSGGKSIKNILPQAPKGRHSSRTWRNSRWQIVRRMSLCLYVHYKYGDMQRICRLVSKPFHVCVLEAVMGKVMDLQKGFLLAKSGKPEDREPDML
jgi:hypothetical protein